MPCSFHLCSHHHNKLHCIWLSIKHNIQHWSNFHYAQSTVPYDVDFFNVSGSYYTEYVLGSTAMIPKNNFPPSSSALFPHDCFERHNTVMHSQCSHWLRDAVEHLAMCCGVSVYLSASQVFLLWAGIPMFEFSQGWTVRMSFPDSAKHRWLPSPYTPHCPQSLISVICCSVRKLLCQFCDIMVLIRAL